jgi:chromate transporter
MNTLPKVLAVSVWLGLVSFGGGPAVVPEMHRQFVDRTGWLTPEEFATGYALAQLAPGPNTLCIVLFGYKAAGLLAALLAPLGIITPGATLSALCGQSWTSLARHPRAVRLRAGLVPVGLGLMAGGVFVVGRTTVTSWPLLALAAGVALVVNRKWIHPALAVVLAGIAGATLSL